MNELLTRILTQSEKILKHIYSLFEYIYGYILYCISLVTSFLVGEKIAVTIVLLSIFFDLILGIWTSIKQDKFTRSRLSNGCYQHPIVETRKIVAKQRY